MTNGQLKRWLSRAMVPVYACLVAAAVFLPLPGPNTPRPRQGIQLVPFQWIADTHRELTLAGLSVGHALAMPALQGAAQNVLLFVPLGIFARMRWNRGFAGAAMLGFCCSLFIETTQLTANWGTAPFQYRIFDMDDLMNNTGGAMLGWTAAVLFLALRVTKDAAPHNVTKDAAPLTGRAAPHTWTAATVRARPTRPAGPTVPLSVRPPAVLLGDPPTQPLRRRP